MPLLLPTLFGTMLPCGALSRLDMGSRLQYRSALSLPPQYIKRIQCLYHRLNSREDQNYWQEDLSIPVAAALAIDLWRPPPSDRSTTAPFGGKRGID
jgi:hypothetical protein